MKIFNIIQASIFIKNNATVVGCGLGNKNKTYIEFKDDEILLTLLQKWDSRDFK